MDVSKNRSCGWFTHLNSDPRNPKNNGTKKKQVVYHFWMLEMQWKCMMYHEMADFLVVPC